MNMEASQGDPNLDTIKSPIFFIHFIFKNFGSDFDTQL